MPRVSWLEVLTSCLSGLHGEAGRGICQGGVMASTVLLRSRSARALGATMVGLSVLMLGSAVTGGVTTVLDFAAPMALFGVLGWAAFWQPYVEVSDGGVTVANTLRTVQVPWPAIESVDGRYGLRMQTAYGRVTAWAASAPQGRERARELQSEAALVVDRPARGAACGGPPRRRPPGAPRTGDGVAPAAAHRARRAGARHRDPAPAGLSHASVGRSILTTWPRWRRRPGWRAAHGPSDAARAPASAAGRRRHAARRR